MRKQAAPSIEELSHRFLSLKAPEDPAALLGVPIGQLKHYARNASKYYLSFKIPKKSGGFRPILAPIQPLKSIQRRLAEAMLATHKPRLSARGYLRGHSILTNAAPHARRRLVLNFDLQDFFLSITAGRIYGALVAKPYSFPSSVARIITKLCCFNDSLPQGAPTSPILSNMICWRLDRDLEHLAKRFRCTYTRYADDLTFSSNAASFHSDVIHSSGGKWVVGQHLEQAIRNNGFSVNHKKTRLSPKNSRQQVTGLVVNSHPNVNRRFVRQIRAMLHAWRKHGLQAAQAEHQKLYARHRKPGGPNPDFRRILLGKINFLGQVCGKQNKLYLNFLSQYAQLEPSFVPPQLSEPEHPLIKKIVDSIWVLECEQTISQGTGFMLEGVGLVTCAHVLGTHTHAFKPGPPPGNRLPVNILARDDAHDIAILEIPPPPKNGAHPAFKMADTAKLNLLDDVIAVGLPGYNIGDTISIRPCKISGRRRRLSEERILLNTGIIAGMSGGPIILPTGEVVGIAATGADRAETIDQADEHGAIPIRLALRLIKATVDKSKLELESSPKQVPA